LLIASNDRSCRCVHKAILYECGPGSNQLTSIPSDEGSKEMNYADSRNNNGGTFTKLDLVKTVAKFMRLEKNLACWDVRRTVDKPQ
jgi:hypothetical protein